MLLSCRFWLWSLGAGFALLLLAASAAVQADTVSVQVGDAVRGTGARTETINFPVTVSGDLGHATVLSFHTRDGSAVAGTDYVAAAAAIVIPAGATTATVPIAVLPNSTQGANAIFHLQLDGASSVGVMPSFGSVTNFTTGSFPLLAAYADFNGDGKADLVVVDNQASTISVMLNTTAPGATTPTFSAQQTFATGAIPHSVALADINGDGRPDVIVANENDGTISVLLNTTAPGAALASFAPQQTFAVGSAPWSVAATDVNGDGRPDLVVANWGSDDVSVLINTSAPGAASASFAPSTTFAVGSGPNQIVAADLDGDGRPDLIVANQFGADVSVLRNTTASGSISASFAAQQTFAAGQTSIAVAAADINGDGKPDLAVANYGDGTVSILLNTTVPGAGSIAFAGQSAVSVGSFPNSLTFADTNGDGKSDLIVRSGNGVAVYANATAPGSAAPMFLHAGDFAAGQGSNAVAATDLNGDGRVDLIVSNVSDNTVSVFLNDTPAPVPSFNLAPQRTFLSGSSPSSVSVADLNGDGKLDVAVASAVDGTVSVLLNSTAPGAAVPTFAPRQTFATGNAPSAILVDVNGDGRPDLIAANFFDENIAVLLNTTAPGAGTVSFAAPVTFAAGVHPINPAVADLNGDGKPDLVVANTIDGTVSVLLSTTAPGAAVPTFAPQQTFATGANARYVAITDVNGDGKPDLVVINPDSHTVTVLLNTTLPGAAVPTFAAAQAVANGVDPFGDAVVADINGDGRPDIVYPTFNGQSVSVLLNETPPGATTTVFNTPQSTPVGVTTSFVGVADLDGDGRPDVVGTYDSNPGAVYVLLNATASGATTVSFVPTANLFDVQANPNALALADINGDGKPDVLAANSGTLSVLVNTQFRAELVNTSATGTLVHDYLFADGFE